MKLVQNSIFLATLKISGLAKRPLTRLLNWGYKQNGLVTEAREKLGDVMCSGKTALSELTRYRYNEFVTNVSGLLEENEPDTLEAVYALLADPLHEQARCLLITTVVQQVCDADRRFGEDIHSLDLQLFRAVESPFDERCEIRIEVFTNLINAPRGPGPSSDFAMKVMEWFPDDCHRAARDGIISFQLYQCLLMHRSQAPLDTHFVEGLASQIKIMMEKAPRMLKPLLNSRISLINGPALTSRMCCDMHTSVLQYVASEEASMRFQNVVPLPDHLQANDGPLPNLVPLPAPMPEAAAEAAAPPAAEVAGPAIPAPPRPLEECQRKAAPLANAMRRDVKLGARFVYSVCIDGAADSETGYVFGKKFYSSVRGAVGKFVNVGGVKYFNLCCPITCDVLAKVLVRLIRANQNATQSATMTEYRVFWVTKTRARIIDSNSKQYDIVT